MTKEMLGDNMVKFLLEGMEVQVLKHNADVLGIEMEKVITYTVTSTDPGVKGNTAQGGGLKPCTIESGATVMVPLFINEGMLWSCSFESFHPRDNFRFLTFCFFIRDRRENQGQYRNRKVHEPRHDVAGRSFFSFFVCCLYVNSFSL